MQQTQASPDHDEPGVEDASRRTRLAHERTQLAWGRTGLTAFAVALGVGRILPELNPDATEWPYVVLGIAFAVYGIALLAYGGIRELEPRGGEAEGRPIVPVIFAAAGGLLGLGTSLLIALG
jgi:putative membrane protein